MMATLPEVAWVALAILAGIALAGIGLYAAFHSHTTPSPTFVPVTITRTVP